MDYLFGSEKRWMMVVAIIGLIAMLAACSAENSNANNAAGSGDDNNAQNENNNEQNNGNNENDEANEVEPEEREPVTLLMSWPWEEDEFIADYKTPIEEHFDHITLEMMPLGPGEDEQIEEVVVAGTIPDIVMLENIEQVVNLIRTGLAFGLDDLIDQNNFDLDRLEQNVIQNIRARGEGELYALPTGLATYSLHYNSDIFDRFGVSYPEDDMTWSEVIDLAIDVTREEDGIQFRGLDLDVPDPALSQFSASAVDPETWEVDLHSHEAFERYFQMIHDVVNIPGNYASDPKSDLLHNWGGNFAGEQNVAMAPIWTSLWHMDAEGLNFDIVTYPVWEGYEGIAPESGSNGLAITSSSEKQDEAFDVLAYVLSEEFQRKRSREGSATILTDQDIRDEFAADRPEYADFNLDSLFLHEPAPGPETIPVHGPNYWNASIELVNSDQSVAEFLREFEEEAQEQVMQEVRSQ